MKNWMNPTLADRARIASDWINSRGYSWAEMVVIARSDMIKEAHNRLERVLEEEARTARTA